MVEGANNTSTESEKMDLLGDYLEREFVRLHSARLTDRHWSRRSLERGDCSTVIWMPTAICTREAICRRAIIGGRPRSAVKSMPSLGQPSLFRGIRGVVDILARQRAAEDHLHVFRRDGHHRPDLHRHL